MLKNPRLLEVLASPIDTAKHAPLEVRDNDIHGAGYQVPIINGIPDFVAHAPPSDFSMTLRLPIVERPTMEMLKEPQCNVSDTPDWFSEERFKYIFLHAAKKGLLLDVGCGQGNRACFERIGFHYIGTDISFNSQQRNSAAPDVDLVADTHRLPIRCSTIAAINSTAVIEHLYLPIAAVNEWARILEPGGLLLGSCSFLEGEHYDSQCHYTALGLYRLLRGAGFIVENIYPGLSLWELHSNSIYFSLPFHSAIGRLHRRAYLFLSEIRRRNSSQDKLMKNAAILNFVARKPGPYDSAP